MRTIGTLLAFVIAVLIAVWPHGFPWLVLVAGGFWLARRERA